MNGFGRLLKHGGMGMVLLVIVMGSLGDVIQFLLKIAGHLFMGWNLYLWPGLPHALPTLQVALFVAGVLAVIVLLVHLTLGPIMNRKLSGGDSWRLSKTVSLFAIPFAVLACAWAVKGAVHQGISFFREDSVVEVGRGTVGRSKRNALQIATALRVYASGHDGEYPQRLEELVTAGILTVEELGELNQTMLPGGIPIPWRYLPGLADSDPGDLPLLVAPDSFYGKWFVVAHNDTSTDLVGPGEYEEALRRWRERQKRNVPSDREADPQS